MVNLSKQYFINFLSKKAFTGIKWQRPTGWSSKEILSRVFLTIKFHREIIYNNLFQQVALSFIISPFWCVPFLSPNNTPGEKKGSLKIRLRIQFYWRILWKLIQKSPCVMDIVMAQQRHSLSQRSEINCRW